MRSRRRWAPGLLLASALFASVLPARAQEPPLQISQYAHTSWTARAGANLGLVFAMAQTPDGYLWVAGSFGLFRFDGLRFVNWQPPGGQTLPSSPYSLLVSRDGTLWIGTYGGLSSWDGRQFVLRHPEIDRGFVTSLLETRDGTVWAGVLGEPGRLCAIRSGQVECSTPEGGGFGGYVWSLAEDNAGRLWVGAESGVWQWRPGPPRYLAKTEPRVGDLTTTTDGELLVGVMGAGLRQRDGDRLVPHPIRRAGSLDRGFTDDQVNSNKLLRDRHGGLWIGTQGQGLIHVKDGQGDTFTGADGLAGNIATSLFEDREGNVWYGSHKGLDRFRRLPVRTLSTRHGLPHELTRSVVATDDGSVWVGTHDGLVRWKDGRPIAYTERDGLASARVQAQYQDADGRLWVATSGGLTYFAGERFVRVDAGPSHEINAITGDAQGNLWLSGDQGLARLHRGRFVDNVPWTAFGRQQRANSLVADRGGLWLAFWDHSGVSYVRDGKVEATYTAAQGLGASHVASLRLDAEGAVWAATGGGGLSRIQHGRVTTLAAAQGLPCDGIHWSTLDDAGSLWMLTVCGLVRIGSDDLAAWIADPNHRVTPRLWAGSDGVPLQLEAPNYFNPPVARGPDGKIWSVGVADVQLFAPDDMPSNPVPPPVHVESLVVDHQSHEVTPGLRLPPRVRDITIGFAALSLADPRSTRFRYRLEGHDDGWQEVVDQRVATYTNLPPGPYRFHVKAANNSGVWNEQGAQFEFSIRPAFYQTTWFRIAVAALLVTLAVSGFELWMHLRMRRLQRAFDATLEARVAERTRIARDLHDTLLQRFHGLLLQFQAAFNLLPDRANESKQVLGRAIDQVAEAITEGRDTVQALRAPVRPETGDLAPALRALATDLARELGRAATARVEVQGDARELNPLVRDECFRIVGEALRNALRHGDAAHIDVEIAYEPRQFRVRVRDDGKGFDPQRPGGGDKPGHFGLSGMRERAVLAGGALSLRSAPGQGTEVTFRAPASGAYSKRPSVRSWAMPRTSASREIGK